MTFQSKVDGNSELFGASMGKCAICRTDLTLATASPSIVKQKSGRCRACDITYAAAYNASEKGCTAFYKARREALTLRHLSFELSKTEWLAVITNARCFYCGGHLPRRGLGLDRINNSKGYSLDNCRPCCANCNRCKGVLSTEEFQKLVRKIYQHWAGK